MYGVKLLNEVEQSASNPGRLTPGNRVPVTHWMEGWIENASDVGVETQSSSLEHCHYNNGFKLKTGNKCHHANCI
jgi:hypothetical protein